MWRPSCVPWELDGGDVIGGKAGNVQPLSQSVSDRTRVASVG